MTSSASRKRSRLAQLSLVLGVAFALPIFSSTYAWLTEAKFDASQNIAAKMIYGLICELLALAVLVYVLFRQGRSLKQIGFDFSWRDIAISLLLAVVAYIATVMVWQIAVRAVLMWQSMRGGGPLDFAPKNTEFLRTKLTAAYVLFILVNPFYEELIARAFTISEVKDLTGSGVAAVLVSVALQTSYHLYQGLLSAATLSATFVVFSLYYLKWKRITPVILAHLYFDLWAMLAYAHR